MKSLKEDYYSRSFSHIYVEKAAWRYLRTQKILDKFQGAKIIEINHYKDIFCRRGQSYALQHQTQNLLLAVKQGNLIYKGAPVCQNFGNRHFYYASCMMNCIYDCEYCYLKGMYPSGNIVIFVNLEDIFFETENLLKNHPVYLCVSYDTDLPAMEEVTGYVEAWTQFAKRQENLNLEIRTKSANKIWMKQNPVSQVIYAFTLSPEAIIRSCEHNTPSLKQRIGCAAEAVLRGFSVRLCFDPMVYCTDWEKHYEAMLESVFSEIDMDKISDVSVGVFRISQDYLKRMKKNEPYSAVAQFPYQNTGGVYQYPRELAERMERFMSDRLQEKIPEEKIFFWKSISEENYV